MRDQINSFINELTKFENVFALRLVAWHETAKSEIDVDGRHALVLFLTRYAMQFQRAQRSKSMAR